MNILQKSTLVVFLATLSSAALLAPPPDDAVVPAKQNDNDSKKDSSAQKKCRTPFENMKPSRRIKGRFSILREKVKNEPAGRRSFDDEDWMDALRFVLAT